MVGLGITISLIIGVVLLIWIGARFKTAKHKFLAVLLIGVILFFYFSAITVFKDKQVDLKSASGIADAFKIYFSWLGSAIGNVQTFTANIVKGFSNNSST
jgi:hypothetical protein